uniref:WD repeat domain 86 n=1 Tax=Petromyzon marinus TaxID=7757 RepID=S4R5W5_PETMA
MGAGSSKPRGGSKRVVRDRMWEVHKGGVCCASVSDDGELLLTGGEDARAALWSTRTLAALAVLEGHEAYVTDCALAPDTSRAFTCSADFAVRVWQIDGGGGGALSVSCAHVLHGHTARVNRLLVHAGRSVYSTSADRTVRRWDAADGSCLAVCEGHTGNVLPLALYLPEGGPDNADEVPGQAVLAAGSMDGTVRLWDETGTALHCLEGHAGPVLCLAVLQNRAALFSGSADGTVRRWDVLTGEAVSEFIENLGSVICMQVARRYLYAGGSDGIARRYIRGTRGLQRNFEVELVNVLRMELTHRCAVFTGSGDGSACSYNAQTGEVMRTFKGHNHIVNCMKVAGDTLFTGSQDGS